MTQIYNAIPPLWRSWLRTKHVCSIKSDNDSGSSTEYVSLYDKLNDHVKINRWVYDRLVDDYRAILNMQTVGVKQALTVNMKIM